MKSFRRASIINWSKLIDFGQTSFKVSSKGIYSKLKSFVQSQNAHPISRSNLTKPVAHNRIHRLSWHVWSREINFDFSFSRSSYFRPHEFGFLIVFGAKKMKMRMENNRRKFPCSWQIRWCLKIFELIFKNISNGNARKKNLRRFAAAREPALPSPPSSTADAPLEACSAKEEKYLHLTLELLLFAIYMARNLICFYFAFGGISFCCQFRLACPRDMEWQGDVVWRRWYVVVALVRFQPTRRLSIGSSPRRQRCRRLSDVGW